MQQILPFEKYNRERGYVCPCCNSFIKLYKRSFNSNMCLALIAIYNSGIRTFTHMENLLREKGYKRCGDFSYLVHYGLLEKLEGKREDGSPKNGMYKITGRGIMFVENKLTVQEKFLMYNSVCEGFDGKEINIKEALGTRFHYDQLMNEHLQLTP